MLHKAPKDTFSDVYLAYINVKAEVQNTMTANHHHSSKDSDDLEQRQPDGSSEVSSFDDPDEDSIFEDCIDATSVEVIGCPMTNPDVVQNNVSADKQQSEEVNADQAENVTYVDDDYHEDESMFLDCVDSTDVDEPYKDSQLITDDIVQNKTGGKMNEYFPTTHDDMTYLEDDCHKDERFGSDEIIENGDCSHRSFENMEPNLTEDSTGSIWEALTRRLHYCLQDVYETFKKMTRSMSSICNSSLRRICGSQNLNEKNQVYVEKTNPKTTRTYRDDAEGAVKVGASQIKSETNGVNKYQNKLQGTDSLGRKGKINVARQTHQRKGTSSCQHKMEVKVKLEIKISKYASRRKVCPSRTFSRKPQWKKIAMKENYMFAGIDHNLNAKRKGWNPEDRYHPDYNFCTIGDKIGYLDFCKDVMPPMNHNLRVRPSQPLLRRDSNRWNDQIREFNSRHHPNGSLCHFLRSHCQDQMPVIGEPLQNVSLLLRKETPMVDGIDSCSLQRLIYRTGLGGTSPLSRCTVPLSVYGQLSRASTFSTGYSIDLSRNEDPVSILILEQTVNDHKIQEEKGELGHRRDLPNNYSYQSRAKISIRKIDSMCAFTFEADIKESVVTSLEQFVWSELHSNQVLRIQIPCQSAQSNLKSFSSANEFALFLKESCSVFTDCTHSTTPTLETSPNKTYLVANGLAVYSETLPGETHSGMDVSTEADVEPLKPSAIREDDCTSCQQVLLCGNIDTKELKYTAATEYTCSNIPSGGQSGKEHHRQRTKTIYVLEQLKYYEAFRRTHPLTAMKTFPQDQAIRKDNSTFASRQIATEPSSGEDGSTCAQFPIVDVAVPGNGYSLKTISEANKIMQSRQRKGDRSKERCKRPIAVNPGAPSSEESEKNGVFLSDSICQDGETLDDFDHSKHERGSFSNSRGGRNFKGDNYQDGRNRPKAVVYHGPLPPESSEKNGVFLSESKGHNGEAPDDFDRAMHVRDSFSNYGDGRSFKGIEDSNNSRSGNIEYIRNYLSKAARRKGVSKERLLVSHQIVDANVPNILISLLNCPANLNGFRETQNAEGDDAENRSIYNLRQQNEELRSNQYCIICCTNRRCVVFIPCGHLVICLYCKNCVKQTCPICRGNISEKIKVLFE